MIVKNCADLVQAVLDEVERSGRTRVLVSGSFDPVVLAELTGRLRHLDCGDPDPDPLGFENLVSAVSPGMACAVVQNPGYFGTYRDLTALISECREWEVPLLVLSATDRTAPDRAALSLAAELNRIPGIRVVTDYFIDRFSIHLGDSVDGADIVAILRRDGIDACEAAALSYPSYPELRPVLIVNAGRAGAALPQALRDALALSDKRR